MSECLADTRVIRKAVSSAPDFGKKHWPVFSKKADPQSVMTAEGYNELQSLDDTRSATEYNADQAKAVSWMPDKGKAERLAHRFGEDGMYIKYRQTGKISLAIFMQETKPRTSLFPID